MGSYYNIQIVIIYNYFTQFIKSPILCSNNILDLLFCYADSFVSNSSVFEPFGPPNNPSDYSTLHLVLTVTVHLRKKSRD